MEIFKLLNFTIVFSFLFMSAAFAIDPFSEALLSLKSELVDNTNSLNDWNVPSGLNPSQKIYACSWTGVTCDHNSTMITGLDISMKNLGGVMSGKQFNLFTNLTDLNISFNSISQNLPIGIFNLTSLTSLDISRNNLSGHFPSGLSNLQQLVVFDAFSNSFSGPLPPEISQLESLKTLNLAGSYFSGPIPSQYGSFKNIEFIHLAGNFLSGDIPPELGNLKTVTHMEIGYNTYHGGIPWQLGNMSELQYLDIAGANLSGSIPKSLSNLTKLHSLFLFRNSLSGLIPWELSKITPLTSLDLSDNLISGPIPESFSELKSLQLLSLMYNDMSGTVPEGIAQLPSLESLFIWNNFFTGSLPESLGRHSKLKWLDVSTNNFMGAIPPDICAGGMLYKLILFSNNFSGGLAPALSNCSSLVRLRIEDNSFSGEVALNFSELSDVTYVDLSRNRFTGGIPADIAQAFKLQYFNVSNNPMLGGTIPPKTWTLPLLQNFSASSCNISDNIPSFQFCELVSVIELNMNKLSGTVPESISNCLALERIYLSHNDLIGHVPEGLAGLSGIRVVDLSHNNFSGSIPMNFGNSSSLVLLNVSFNDISGSIPSEMSFRMMGSSAFVGNPKLCGAPLHHCPNSKEIRNEFQLGSKRTQKLAWVLILCAAVVLFITCSAFGVFYFRKESKGQWEMVSFIGLPQFTANDVLRSLSSIEVETVPPLSGSVCKAVMPTGITVSVKRVEWDAKRMKIMAEFVNRIGNVRHKNLIRLLGFCYNKDLAYLLYDYLPNGNMAEKIRVKRDWAAKHKIMIGIARGLCFLHHDCYPPIPHGDLRASNIMFDENMEPHLAEVGFRFLQQRNKFPSPAKTGEFGAAIKEELNMDIYNFGEVILEIITNGRLTNAGECVQSKARDVVLGEIYNDSEVGSSNSFQEEVKLVLDVALLCTRNRPSDRPSMEEALKLLLKQDCNISISST